MGMIGIQDPFHQDFKGAAREDFDRLVDRGDGYRAYVGIDTVVIADQRHIPGDGDSTFGGGVLNAQCDTVAESENGSDILFKQFQSAVIAAFNLVISVINQ